MSPRAPGLWAKFGAQVPRGWREPPALEFNANCLDGGWWRVVRGKGALAWWKSYPWSFILRHELFQNTAAAAAGVPAPGGRPNRALGEVARLVPSGCKYIYIHTYIYFFLFFFLSATGHSSASLEVHGPQQLPPRGWWRPPRTARRTPPPAGLGRVRRTSDGLLGRWLHPSQSLCQPRGSKAHSITICEENTRLRLPRIKLKSGTHVPGDFALRLGQGAVPL